MSPLRMKCKMHNTSGLSLMEVAMILMMLGVLMASFLAGYRVYQAQRGEQVTTRSFDEIEEAIAGYVAKNGRYPIPMGLMVADNDPAYGYQSAVSSCPPAGPSGPETCRRPSGAVPSKFILTGAIPFKELNIAEQFIYDAFKRRITYVVAEDLTTMAGNLPANYAICARKQTYNPAYNLETCAAATRQDIALISHGVDGFGAYTAAGKQYRQCNSGGNQDENCNFDGDIIDATTSKANFAGAQRNDDRISFDMKLNPNLWLQQAGGVYNTTELQVGIGVEMPKEPLDVVGNIEADRVRTAQICSNDGSNGDTACFDPDKIGGTGMKCPARQVMISVQNAQAVCVPMMNTLTCPPGQYLAGITAAGAPVCRVAVAP